MSGLGVMVSFLAGGAHPVGRHAGHFLVLHRPGQPHDPSRLPVVGAEPPQDRPHPGPGGGPGAPGARTGLCLCRQPPLQLRHLCPDLGPAGPVSLGRQKIALSDPRLRPGPDPHGLHLRGPGQPPFRDPQPRPGHGHRQKRRLHDHLSRRHPGHCPGNSCPSRKGCSSWP